MPQLTLPYSVIRWRDMRQNDDPTHHEFITEVLRADKRTIEKFCFRLLENFMGNGSPSIDDFAIDEVDFDKHLLSGTVDVSFVVDFYFGCDGMDNQQEETETVSFRLNGK